MTGALLELHFDDAEIRRAVGYLYTFDGGERATRLWHAIGAAGVASTQLRFDQQHGPGGAPWKPSQRALKDGGKTLQLSGMLLASITYNLLGADGVEWGSNLPYAPAMQGGADITVYPRSQQIYQTVSKAGVLNQKFVRPSKSNFARWVEVPEYHIHIEARPYLGIDEEDIAEFTDTALRHVDAALMGTRP